MPKNKTPGNDGLPVELYLIFFDVLGPELLKCINECYKEGTLTISQRQATVTLKEKPESCLYYINFKIILFSRLFDYLCENSFNRYGKFRYK